MLAKLRRTPLPPPMSQLAPKRFSLLTSCARSSVPTPSTGFADDALRGFAETSSKQAGRLRNSASQMSADTEAHAQSQAAALQTITGALRELKQAAKTLQQTEKAAQQTIADDAAGKARAATNAALKSLSEIKIKVTKKPAAAEREDEDLSDIDEL